MPFGEQVNQIASLEHLADTPPYYLSDTGSGDAFRQHRLRVGKGQRPPRRRAHRFPRSSLNLANRGSAMGGFVAFLDIAYGISGPAAGVIAGQFGYAAVYLFGAVCALLGGALVATARPPQS